MHDERRQVKRGLLEEVVDQRGEAVSQQAERLPELRVDGDEPVDAWLELSVLGGEPAVLTCLSAPLLIGAISHRSSWASGRGARTHSKMRLSPGTFWLASSRVCSMKDFRSRRTGRSSRGVRLRKPSPCRLANTACAVALMPKAGCMLMAAAPFFPSIDMRLAGKKEM